MLRKENQILEYFFGTETLKQYRNEQVNIENFVKYPQHKTQRKNNRNRKYFDLIIGKYLPNTITVGSIIYSVYTITPPYFIPFGEAIRFLWIKMCKKGSYELIKNNMRRNVSRFQNQQMDEKRELSDLLDTLDDDKEGEEWKRT